MYFVKSFLLALCLLMINFRSSVPNNVDPTTAIRIKPTKPSSEVVYQFGTSMQMQRSGSEFTLHVGAPYYNSTDQEVNVTNQPIKNGSVYECRINLQKKEQTCNSMKEFSKNGAMGLTLQINSPTNEILVCGNQYTYECPEANIVQRMIGSCYSYDGLRGNKELKTPCLDVCPQRTFLNADIVFVLDESGSVGKIDFNSTLYWTIQLLSSFKNDIDNGYVRVGVIIFNSKTRVPIQLNRYNYNQLTNDIKNIGYNGGGTSIGKAILTATSHFQTYGRLDAAKEMIVLTDGQSGDNTIDPANKARLRGISTVGVGVGGNVYDQTLLEIAGNSSRIFRASDYNNLDSVVGGLTTVIKDSAVTVLEGQSSNTTNNLTQCQTGTAAYLHQTSSLYIGAVGSYDRAGSVISYSKSNAGVNTMYKEILNKEALKSFIYPSDFIDFKEAYLGYSLTTGNFFGGADPYVASGAPNYFSKGVVVIYNPELATYPTSSNYLLHPHNSSSLWQLGAYFGQSLCSIDLNKDGFDDLLVSAPLYSDVSGYDQGRVFVFMNDPTKPGLQGWMPSNFLPQILVGSNSIGARFGMNVVSGGDIDRNGYNDVVIGAPHEGDSVGGSGAVYIYYTDSNGLSESRKQKILGSEVFFPLHGFGTSIIQGDAGKFDVDNNLYPDVVASAPSSDSVLVLLSRPIVDVSAEIIINSPVINFLNCLDDINKTCTTFHLCFNASQRMNPTASNFEMDVTISLDSMISNTQDKRLIFKDSETSTINNIQIITNHKECNSYNVTLNGISFSNLVKGNVFETIPEVNVTYRFTQAHQNKRLSAILDPFVPTTLSKTWALSNNCLKSSRKCTHDLVALAQYSLPSSSRPYVLGQNSKLFEVNVTVRNDGPDLSYFTKISITSRQLRFSKVIGDCVQVIDSESDVLLLGISLPSISSNTGIFPQGSSCNFLLQYPLETIANLGTISEIFVNGSIYSSLSAATGNEVNEGNNHFQYRRQVRYSAKLRISRISFPSTLYYNRSLAPTFARTLNDPVLGGNTSNLNHSYVITNNGPHMVTTASLIYSWPASFLNNTNIPLLYLYDFQCMPSSICKCDVEGKINPFNLSFANKSDSNVHLEFPQLDQFPEGTECSSINCEMIKCTLTNFKQYQSVRIMSSLKTWLPSFSSPDSVALESTLVVNISESLISKTNKLVYYAQAVTTVAKYTPPTSTNPDAANNLGAIIGGIIGGIVLLIVIGFILWKAGFFQSKYSEMLNDAKEDADVEPQGAQASDEDILNQT